MKKLSTLLVVLSLLIGGNSTATTADNLGYPGTINSFIFVEGGVEFAIFPDGQFDFNFLDNGPLFYAGVQTPHVNLSFNTGFNYDPFVQYDAYGAVIQIENVPVFYDPYGRIIQAGNVQINYRNGYVRNIGNLFVTYRRPGVVYRYRGFVNRFNRFYVNRPWHAFYAPPVFNRCIVFASPYRNFYNPIRFSWNYHRNHWNLPTYYNGRFAHNRGYREFYRPNDRFDYRDFEQGRRNSRGRLVAARNVRATRNDIARGRQSLERSATSRSTRAAAITENSRRNNGAVAPRSVREQRSSTRSANSRSERASRMRTSTERTTAPIVSNRSNSNREVRATRSSRSSREAAPARQARQVTRSEAPSRVSRSTAPARSRATSSRTSSRSQAKSRPSRTSTRTESTRSSSRSNSNRSGGRGSSRG